jgi:hypothetical protein
MGCFLLPAILPPGLIWEELPTVCPVRKRMFSEIFVRRRKFQPLGESQFLLPNFG